MKLVFLGGLYAWQEGQSIQNLMLYVGVDDIEATLAQAEAAGGKILAPKSEVPGMGWMGVFADPDGTPMGLWTAMEQSASQE